MIGAAIQCSTVPERSERLNCVQAVARGTSVCAYAFCAVEPRRLSGIVQSGPGDFRLSNPLASDRALQRSGATWINQA